MQDMDYTSKNTQSLTEMLLQRFGQLEQEGLVDAHFQHCHSLKEYSGPVFFLNLVQVFCADVQTVLTQMTNSLNHPVVNFPMMLIQCIKLKGSSSCIGACRLADACSDLQVAINNQSVQGCRDALENINKEYTTLSNRLQSIIEIEQEIVYRGTS